jgi:hypothetical protein
MPFGRKLVVDPSKMTCEQFAALDKDVQPVVAYWLDGYTQAARGETKGAKRGGSQDNGVQPIALDRDVQILLDECSEKPKAPLSEKIEKKFRLW